MLDTRIQEIADRPTPRSFGWNSDDSPVIDPYAGWEMSTGPKPPSQGESLELSVEELLRRARPLPSHQEMVIDDLTEKEGAAFLAALDA